MAKFVTVTRLAARLRLTAIDLNAALEAEGYQFKREKAWEPTNKGIPFCREGKGVDRKGNDFTLLAWNESILPLLEHLASPSRKDFDQMRKSIASLETRLAIAEGKLA